MDGDSIFSDSPVDVVQHIARWGTPGPAGTSADDPSTWRQLEDGEPRRIADGARPRYIGDPGDWLDGDNSVEEEEEDEGDGDLEEEHEEEQMDVGDHDEEEDEATSPRSISSDLTDRAFGAYMEAKIGLATNGDGWMGEEEARAKRRGPIIIGDMPSGSDKRLCTQPTQLLLTMQSCYMNPAAPIPHADFRKLILAHLDQTDWMYQQTTAVHPMVPSAGLAHTATGGFGTTAAGSGAPDPLLALFGGAASEDAIRVIGHHFAVDSDIEDDYSQASSPPPLEGDFEALAVREGLGIAANASNADVPMF